MRKAPLHGQVALITGAARGQGRAAALALARAGASIVALDVAATPAYPGYPLATPEDLDSVRKECERLGADCHTVIGDVRDDTAVSRAVATAVYHFGRIDVLFNNAGIMAYGLTHELTEDEWDCMLDVNLKGAWLVARRTIPVMINQHSGVIINNSSVAGVRGMNRLSHYVASKWGLLGLTKSWAIELAPYGIRVVAICPTGVDTGMIDGLAGLAGTTPAEVAEHTPNLLPISLIDPEDVAEVVLFLAGRQARTITGSTLVLDAGMLTK